MIASWMLRATITALCITIAAHLADRSARLAGGPRRWVWMTALIASVCIPVATPWISVGHPLQHLLGHFPGSIIPTVLASTQSVLQALPARPQHNILALLFVLVSSNILFVCWMIASALTALVLLAMHGWLRMRSAQWPASHLDSVPVLITPRLGPAVIGIIRPVVVLPAWVLGAPAQARHLILQHEGEHIRAGDSRLLALSMLAVVVMPWNAFMWWQYRQLHAAVESDCDARVLARGNDIRQYGEVLLQVAARAIPTPVLSSAFCVRGSNIRRRIIAMTPASASRHRTQRAVLAVATLFTAMMACDVASAVAAPQQVLHFSPRSTIHVTIHGIVRLNNVKLTVMGDSVLLVPRSGTFSLVGNSTFHFTLHTPLPGKPR